MRWLNRGLQLAGGRQLRQQPAYVTHASGIGKLEAGVKWIGQFRQLATQHISAMPVLAKASKQRDKRAALRDPRQCQQHVKYAIDMNGDIAQCSVLHIFQSYD